ncbi:hypothetical protein LTR86_001937 [Recurvomyces mirabilis]|nr:hypothetical protein LTR86_001937 [Recurvomyces mirabilis]
MQNRHTLTNLPTELRLQIFTHVLSSPYPLGNIKLGDSLSSNNTFTSLLLTTRSLHNESRPLLYDLNTFNLTPEELARFPNPFNFARIRDLRIVRWRDPDDDDDDDMPPCPCGLRGLGQMILAMVKTQQYRLRPPPQVPATPAYHHRGAGGHHDRMSASPQWRLRLASTVEQPFDLLIEHPPLRTLWEHILARHPLGSADDLSTFLLGPRVPLSRHLSNHLTEAVLTAVLDHDLDASPERLGWDSWPPWMKEEAVGGSRRLLDLVEMLDVQLTLEKGGVFADDGGVEMGCLRVLGREAEKMQWGDGLRGMERRKRLEWANEGLVKVWEVMEGDER